MKKFPLFVLSIFLLLNLCACSGKSQSSSAVPVPSSSADQNTSPALPDDVCFVVNITVETDAPFCAAQAEFYLKRKAVGGAAYGYVDSGETYSKGELIQFDIIKALFSDESKTDGFGIAMTLYLDDGNEILLDSLVEWDAKKGSEYNFNLYGNPDEGFTLTPAATDFECKKIPWSELPKELLP